MSFSPRNQHINRKEKAIRLIRLWYCVFVYVGCRMCCGTGRRLTVDLSFNPTIAAAAAAAAPALSSFILCGFCFGAVCLWFIAVASDLNNAVHMPNAHKHTHTNAYPQCEWIHNAYMANECAFFIRNIFELDFIHRRYSYWYPLNLASAVGLWVGRKCAAAHGRHTSTLYAHALLWFEHVRRENGIDENLYHYYYWSK